MGSKIPVTVIAGAQRSGKTALLNRVLAAQAGAARASSIVLSHSAGSGSVQGARVSTLSSKVAIKAGGCLCCAVSGELVHALRALFLDALHRKTPAFTRVLIEVAGDEDPAPIMYTLQYDAFLRDRYVYGGCVTVVNAVQGLCVLHGQAAALRQAVLANALVIEDANLADSAAMASLGLCLRGVNPDAAVLMADDPRVGDALLAGTIADWGHPGMPSGITSSARPSLWKGGGLRAAARSHGADVGPGSAAARYVRAMPAGFQVLMVRWPVPVARAEVMLALDSLKDDTTLGLLQVRGVLRFARDARAWRVRCVHGQLYPLEALALEERAIAHESVALDPDVVGRAISVDSVLVMTFLSAANMEIQAKVLAILPKCAELVSPDSNLPLGTVALRTS
ncbi:GTP-binding protein [Allopusillimonas ginsengisoli]|uniref:GTP-binding protein n=1 Tax=Allopusillimonas ginsengisoli TaxID=453575 RepID=UPI00101EE261|nr:GTP-binding protein [Allopusillimonas ginsengisoli]TEA78448.1 hypothetical protein ERE07_08525 [Allopusillimonas ginsengisoli]